MKTILVLILHFFTLQLFSQTVWFPQVSGTAQNLFWVQFLDVNTGYACGSGGIFLKTTNSGANWNSVGINQSNFKMLQFLNSQTGFVSGDSGIYRTTNAGINWTTVYTGNDGWYIHFTDVNTGIKVLGSVGRTTNGGLNWQTLSFFPPGGITSLYYINNENVYCTGWDWIMHVGGLYTARIMKSVNGGANWNTQYYSTMSFCCSQTLSVSFPELSRGYAVGYERDTNYFYKTSNSGVNWSKQQIVDRMYSTQFYNTETGWICGEQGKILFTTNSGTTFYTQFTGASSTIRKIYMLNKDTGFAVGDNGLILRTTIGGFTGINTVSIQIPENFSLTQNYPNPFNPVTRIKFQIPLSRGVPEGRGVLTQLSIYDALGKEVALLVNEQLQPGTYEADWDASAYPSGVYYYKMEVSPSTGSGRGFSETKKMVLIK